MILKRISMKSHKGQGFAEYAIVIALVAIVCIIILGLVGLAASRGYGLVAGALGAKKEVGGSVNYIKDFDGQPPQCGTVRTVGNPSIGQRLFYAQFRSDFHFDTDKSYTVATDTGVVPDILTNPPLGPDAWTVNANLTSTPNVQCPTSLVIQLPKSKGGGTVAYTVVNKDWN